jgi:hypothetical protein
MQIRQTVGLNHDTAHEVLAAAAAQVELLMGSDSTIRELERSDAQAPVAPAAWEPFMGRRNVLPPSSGPVDLRDTP